MDHAVVIGGGIAGLLAAGVLAETHHVTILERDNLVDTYEHRKGVPQDRHLHQMLMRGQQILEILLPGITESLVQAGAVPVNWPHDIVWFRKGQWCQRWFDTDINTYACTRALLESHIRRRISQHTNVTIRTGHVVTRLTATSDNATINGVIARCTADHSEQRIQADLVVDTSGRSSHIVPWLTELGYPKPREERVGCQLGYASRLYQGPTPPWKILIVQSDQQIPLGGAIFPIEGDRWIATVSGALGDYPPTDDAGFLAFAARLPHTILYEYLRAATPLSQPFGYRDLDNRRHMFHQLARWPQRLVVLGDAAMQLNPVYGQGMTVAALGALTLRDWISTRQPTHRFQQHLARIQALPWSMATGEDRRYANSGKSTLIQSYMDRVLDRAMSDQDTYIRFERVAHLLRSPTVLFHPQVLWQVLWPFPAATPQVSS